MNRLWRGLAAAAAIAALWLPFAQPALASYVVKDGAGVTQTMCSVDSGTGVKTPCHTTPDGSQTGTLNAAAGGASYQMTLGQGQASETFYVSGLGASGATLTFKGTVDGTNYAPINRPDATTGVPTSTITADGLYSIPVHGKSAAGLFVTTPGTGTITLTSTSSIAPTGDVALNKSLPPGTNNVGKVTPQVGGSDVGSTNPMPTLPPQAAVTETTVNMTGQWVKVWTATAAKRVVVGFPSDCACTADYSFNAGLSGTSTSGGIVLSTGNGGEKDWAGGAVPNTDLYLKATSGSKATVDVEN